MSPDSRRDQKWRPDPPPRAQVIVSCSTDVESSHDASFLSDKVTDCGGRAQLMNNPMICYPCNVNQSLQI